MVNHSRFFMYCLLVFLICSCSSTKSSAGGDNGVTKDTIQNYYNPIIDYDTPDPTVMEIDGKFYLFATENNHVTPVWISTDLVHWTKKDGSAFASRPSFVPDGGVWAPDAHYIDGQYVLYYAMSTWGGEWKCGIGVGVSNYPDGPYTDLGKIFTSEEIKVQNSIDEFFIQDNGHNYLFWGSFHGIYGIELTPDGLHIKEGAQKVKIAGDFMEATYIHKRNGYYYLFGSNGTCCEGDNSTYQIVYGRSKSLFGPYVTREGGRLLDGNFDVLLHGNGKFVGPGHNAEFMIDDAGQDWIIYHSYLRGKSDMGRVAMLDPINWTDDWPVIVNNSPSTFHKIPFFKK
jgi:arabinan endo-1,5-alpha-L-arabinosidase